MKKGGAKEKGTQIKAGCACCFNINYHYFSIYLQKKTYWSVNRFFAFLLVTKTLKVSEKVKETLPCSPNTFLMKVRKIIIKATPANNPTIIANVFSPSLLDLSAMNNESNLKCDLEQRILFNTLTFM